MKQYNTGKAIKHISILIEKNINKMLAVHDLSATQGVTLLFLSEAQGHQCPIKELEQHFDTAQSTMFGIITRLEKKGFVSSFTDESRTKMVEITADGLNLCGYIQHCIETCEEDFFRCLTSTEKMIMIEILKKVEESYS